MSVALSELTDVFLDLFFQNWFLRVFFAHFILLALSLCFSLSLSGFLEVAKLKLYALNGVE
jgi:hypothetical protein